MFHCKSTLETYFCNLSMFQCKSTFETYFCNLCQKQHHVSRWSCRLNKNRMTSCLMRSGICRFHTAHRTLTRNHKTIRQHTELKEKIIISMKEEGKVLPQITYKYNSTQAPNSSTQINMKQFSNAHLTHTYSFNSFSRNKCLLGTEAKNNIPHFPLVKASGRGQRSSIILINPFGSGTASAMVFCWENVSLFHYLLLTMATYFVIIQV